MKKILPSLTLAGIAVTVYLFPPAVLAESLPNPASTDAEDSQAAADRLLFQALSQLASFDSVNAKIRQQIDLGGHQLIGDGVYFQTISGRDVLLRMELKVQVADELCSTLQVSDGRDLWIEEQRCGQRSVRRIDVREVASSFRKHRPRLEELGGGRLPLGGLPEWLHSLTVNFQFAYAGETELAGVPVSMLVGRWRQDNLVQMLPDQKEQIEAGKANLSQLPEHVPQEVVLLLGQDDFFPYLIDYRRYDRASDKKPLAPQSILRVQIYEVRLGGPIDLRQFVYQPGQVDVSDGTAATVKLLATRVQRQMEERKKSKVPQDE